MWSEKRESSYAAEDEEQGNGAADHGGAMVTLVLSRMPSNIIIYFISYYMYVVHVILSTSREGNAGRRHMLHYTRAQNNQ